MDSKTFDIEVERLLGRIKEVLLSKGEEYATEDRLHNFKAAAHIQKETPRQALVGMMAKHTVSIYDMGKSTKNFSRAQWDEKIIDHLNYLILLSAVVTEEVYDMQGVENNHAPMATEGELDNLRRKLFSTSSPSHPDYKEPEDIIEETHRPY